MQRIWHLKFQPFPTQPARLMFIGLGSIGLNATYVALKRNDLQVVAGVDVDPEKVGHDIGQLARLKQNGVIISDDLLKTVRTTKPTVAIVATTSRLTDTVDLIAELINEGVHVVSSAEEMFFPWLVGNERITKLDRLAKEKKVSVIGAGVNPGFVMDRLPAFLAQASSNPRRLIVNRFVDVSTRRQQLQEKVGVGLNLMDFELGVLDGRIGHVGLPQSIAFLSASLGLKLSHITENIQPIVSNGQVKGIEQIALGWEEEHERIRLKLHMALNLPDPHDEIEIDSDPPLKVIVKGGIAGDEATASLLVNTATWIDQLPHGISYGGVWFPRPFFFPIFE